MHHSEINTFHNVCKSKISFTELYEFIRHTHECSLTLFCYNKGSKIYPQNQVILDCFMPSIRLKHLSISLIWVIVSLKQ